MNFQKWELFSGSPNINLNVDTKTISEQVTENTILTISIRKNASFAAVLPGDFPLKP